MTSFNEFLIESKSYSNKTIESIISKDVGVKVKLKNNSLLIDDKVVIEDYQSLNYPDIIQSVIDYIRKNIVTDDIKEISSSFKSILNNSSYINIDPLSKYIKRYSNNSVIVVVNSLSDQIVGVSSSKSIQSAADMLTNVRHGYSLYVLDGAYNGIKIKMNEHVSGWIIAPGFEYERSIGATQVLIDNKLTSIKHIRKKS